MDPCHALDYWRGGSEGVSTTHQPCPRPWKLLALSLADARVSPGEAKPTRK